MTTTATNGSAATTTAPAEVVTSFLQALVDGDAATATSLLAPDADWVNVSLPTVHGRDAIMQLWGVVERPWAGFRVQIHNIASEDNIVLTERHDELRAGPFAHRFWVYGRFEVRDGQITLWRDSFDWSDIASGAVRALAGIVAPGLNRRWPES